jgi:hypothetical protein
MPDTSPNGIIRQASPSAASVMALEAQRFSRTYSCQIAAPVISTFA